LTEFILKNNKVKLAIYPIFLVIVLFLIRLFDQGATMITRGDLHTFSTIFLSIVFEAMPFVMIGVFASSVIQVFVSEELLTRIIPKNSHFALFAASISGFMFPICECANVPVTRRLVKKGMPLSVAITFMLAVAIVNPIVLLSTYYAFGGSLRVVLFRGGIGLVGAILIGFIIGLIYKNGERELNDPEVDLSCGCGHDHHHEVHDHDHSNHHESSCCSHDHHGPVKSIKDKALQIVDHMSGELYSVGRFLILGAFLSGMIQTMLPRQLLVMIGQGPVISVITMMLLAYGLSLCAEADAFIARSFIGQFTPGSIMAFMIFGPMIDVKNTLMLLDGFKTKFVLRIIGIVFLFCLMIGLIINLLGL